MILNKMPFSNGPLSIPQSMSERVVLTSSSTNDVGMTTRLRSRQLSCFQTQNVVVAKQRQTTKCPSPANINHCQHDKVETNSLAVNQISSTTVSVRLHRVDVGCIISKAVPPLDLKKMSKDFRQGHKRPKRSPAGMKGTINDARLIPTTHAWYRRIKYLLKRGGSTRSVYVSRSGISGQGVFTKKAILEGAIIMLYLGDVISQSESNRRDILGNGDYFAKFTYGKVIDGRSKARYVNHSCDPNCVLELMIFANRAATTVITASKNISTGEELTFNYHWKEGRGLGHVQIPCHCGAGRCYKFLNQ